MLVLVVFNLLILGTVDAVAQFNNKKGEIAFLDWKTSKQLRGDYAIQIAAYAKAYEEMYEKPVSTAFLVYYL